MRTRATPFFLPLFLILLADSICALFNGAGAEACEGSLIPQVFQGWETLLNDRKILFISHENPKSKLDKIPLLQLDVPTCPVKEIAEPLSTCSIKNNIDAWQQSVRRSAFVTQKETFLRDTLVGGSVQSLNRVNEISVDSSSQSASNTPHSDIQLASPEALAVLDDAFASLLGLPSCRKLQDQGCTAVRYKVAEKRIDTIVEDENGNLRLVTGKPDSLAPEPPALDSRWRALANVAAPQGHKPLIPSDIMPLHSISESSRVLLQHNHAALERCLAKLNSRKGINIIFWGDSVTRGGFASSDEYFFASQFMSLLKKSFPGNQLGYLNMGTPGANSLQMLHAFQESVKSKQVDLIIVEFVNDYRLPVAELEKSYLEMIDRAEQSGTDLIICVPHLVLPDYLKLNTWQDVSSSAFPDLLRKLCRTHNAAIADVAHRWASLEKEGLRPDLLLSDGLLHPNDLGHKIYAEEILGCFLTGEQKETPQADRK